jgi:hypothetical protein
MPHRNDCTSITPACPLDQTIYGYYPSMPTDAFFLAIFAILTLSNLILGLRFRTYTYTVAMVFGCLGEAIGYVGRIPSLKSASRCRSAVSSSRPP